MNYTYQDFLVKSQNEKSKQEFVVSAVDDYKAGDFYKMARSGENYARQKNEVIMNYKKLLYSVSGATVPDNYTANHKCASNFFDRFITQETQYLLGNGVIFEKEDTKEKIDRKFDSKIQFAAKYALMQGVCYGFNNLDTLEIFKATEFCPLYDEENGAMKAGIRFWTAGYSKPMRYTLFELDGYTDYIKDDDDEAVKILHEKRPYILNIKTSKADGTRIYSGENYDGFPIVPLWANPYHQSELVGIKEQIDCYDLIKSGFANDLDDASMIYWTLNNCGGMDDIDLAKFIERMKTVKAAVVDGDAGANAEAHTLDVPYQSRETYLKMIENDLYKDFMALNVENIAAGQTTATQIQAAYEPLNEKADQFEYCVTDFIEDLLYLKGIEDTPTYKRSVIRNTLEETQMIMSASSILDTETIIKKLPFIMPDEIEDVLNRINAEEYELNEEGEE